jgi:broad-specificity NMP kinase
MWEINMPDKMETEARERYDEYRENFEGDITQEQHDEIIEEVFNSRQEFYTRKDVSDYLDNDFLEYTKYIKKYTEWMDDRDKSLDPVQIMNMCWYIAGKEIHFEI